MEEQTPSSCLADPNFAIIAAFFDKFGKMCGIIFPSVSELIIMLECTESVPQDLALFHTHLLRRIRRQVSVEKWEKVAVKFCQQYSLADAANLEQHGYANCNVDLKLRLLKHLLYAQFDCNAKLKTAVNLLTSEELRPKPLGKDDQGRIYWVQLDSNARLRVYREELESEDNEWTLIATDRDSLVKLLYELTGDDSLDLTFTTDTGPDIKDPPVLDTGQNTDEDSGEGEVGIPLSDGATEIDEQSPAVDDEKNGPEVPLSDASTEVDEESSKMEDTENDAGLSLPEDSMHDVEEDSKTGDSKIDAEDIEPKTSRLVGMCSEAIEEPVMIVKGDGNGVDCETGCLQEENDAGLSLPEDSKTGDSKIDAEDIEPKTSRLDGMCSEAIEEPVKIVKGDGNGVDCETGCLQEENDRGDTYFKIESKNSDDVLFLCSEAVEEPIMYFFGVGSGEECNIGNPDREPTSSDDVTITKEKSHLGSPITTTDIASESAHDTVEAVPNKDHRNFIIDSKLPGLTEKADSTVIENTPTTTKSASEALDLPQTCDSTSLQPKLWSINDICGSQHDEESQSTLTLKKPDSVQNYLHKENETEAIKCCTDDSLVTVGRENFEANDSEANEEENVNLGDVCDKVQESLRDSFAVKAVEADFKNQDVKDTDFNKCVTSKLTGLEEASLETDSVPIVRIGEGEILEPSSNCESDLKKLGLLSQTPGETINLDLMEGKCKTVDRKPTNSTETLRVPEIIITPNTPTFPETVLSPSDSTSDHSQQGGKDIIVSSEEEKIVKADSSGSEASVKKVDEIGVPNEIASESMKTSLATPKSEMQFTDSIPTSDTVVVKELKDTAESDLMVKTYNEGRKGNNEELPEVDSSGVEVPKYPESFSSKSSDCGRTSDNENIKSIGSPKPPSQANENIQIIAKVNEKDISISSSQEKSAFEKFSEKSLENIPSRNCDNEKELVIEHIASPQVIVKVGDALKDEWSKVNKERDNSNLSDGDGIIVDKKLSVVEPVKPIVNMLNETVENESSIGMNNDELKSNEKSKDKLDSGLVKDATAGRNEPTGIRLSTSRMESQIVTANSESKNCSLTDEGTPMPETDELSGASETTTGGKRETSSPNAISSPKVCLQIENVEASVFDEKSDDKNISVDIETEEKARKGTAERRKEILIEKPLKEVRSEENVIAQIPLVSSESGPQDIEGRLNASKSQSSEKIDILFVEPKTDASIELSERTEMKDPLNLDTEPTDISRQETLERTPEKSSSKSKSKKGKKGSNSKSICTPDGSAKKNAPRKSELELLQSELGNTTSLEVSDCVSERKSLRNRRTGLIEPPVIKEKPTSPVIKKKGASPSVSKEKEKLSIVINKKESTIVSKKAGPAATKKSKGSSNKKGSKSKGTEVQQSENVTNYPQLSSMSATTEENATEVKSVDTVKRSHKKVKSKKKSVPRKEEQEDPDDSATKESPTNKPDEVKEPPKRSGHHQITAREMKLLGLPMDAKVEDTGERSIRASRRIAQIKIKEAEDRRREEEVTFETFKQSGKKSDKEKDETKPKKNKSAKKKYDVDEDYEGEDETTKEGKSKKKKRKSKKPWLHSSDSSSQEEEIEDYEIEEEPQEEENIFKSDHEFSPESDIDEDPEYRPTPRARTAKAGIDASLGEDKYADTTCESCKSTDRPDWILLCDNCDKGWHTDCVKPILHIVPEGQWFCPPCSHESLINALKLTLREFDRLEKQRENEELRKKRLAFVGISLDNVLPAKKKKETAAIEEDGSSSDSASSSSGSTGSSSDSEPVYQLRDRRSNVTSYRYNEYDEMIRSAIQDDVAPVIPKGREIEDDEETEEDETMTEKKEVDKPAPINEVLGNSNKDKEEGANDAKEGSDKDDDYAGETEDDDLVDEVPPVVPRRGKEPTSKKKRKKLNDLGFTSEEDRNSDSDFKGATESESEEVSAGSASSEEWGGRRKHRGAVRRSTRARRRRYDKDFIHDDTSEDEDEVSPKKRKRRDLCTDESSDSDRSWGARGSRKRSKRSRVSSSPRWSKKKRKHKRSRSGHDSNEGKPRKRRIKYGGLDDSDEDRILPRKTRGRKMDYTEDIEDDSDELEGDKIKKKKPGKGESDTEFVVEPGKEGDEEEDEEDEYLQEEDSEDSEDEPPIKAKKGKVSSPKGKTTSKKKNVIKDTDSEPDVDLEDLDDEEEEKLMEMLEAGDIPVDQLKAAVKRVREEKKHKHEKEKSKDEFSDEELEDSSINATKRKGSENTPEEEESESDGEQLSEETEEKMTDKAEEGSNLSMEEEPKEEEDEVEKIEDSKIDEKVEEPKVEEKPKRKNVKITPTRAELEAVKERERAVKAMVENVTDAEDIEKDRKEISGGLLLRSLQAGPSPSKSLSSLGPAGPVATPLPIDELPATIATAVTPNNPIGANQISKLGQQTFTNLSPQQCAVPRMAVPQEIRGPHPLALRGVPPPQQGNRAPLQNIPLSSPYQRPGLQGYPGPLVGPPGSAPGFPHNQPGVHPQSFRPQGPQGPNSQLGVLSQRGRSQSPQGPISIPLGAHNPSNPRLQGALGIKPPSLQGAPQGSPGSHLHGALHQGHVPPGQLLHQGPPGQSGPQHIPTHPGQQSSSPKSALIRPQIAQGGQSNQGPAMISLASKPAASAQQSSPQGQVPASPGSGPPLSHNSPVSHNRNNQSPTLTPPKHQQPFPGSPQQHVHTPYSEGSFSPEPVKQRKKPGPKPGSKNKKKTEEEIQALGTGKGKPRGKKGDDVTIATVQAPTQFPDAVTAEGGSVITRMLNSQQGTRSVQDQPSGRFPGAPMYHAAHPMDPSPSGGAAVSVAKQPFNPENFPQYQNFQHYSNFPPEQSQSFQPPPFSEPPNFPSSQAAPPPATQPSQSGGKQFDEENGGEFGGLASYFASQAEEDMDT